MITLNQLSMTYGHRLLFYDVNLILNPGFCYALVGANGSGKSTFFRLMTGEEEHTSGQILMPKDATIGWLKQDQFRHEETPIRQIVLQGKPALWKAMQERDELLASGHWDDETGFRYAALEEIIVHHQGYTALAEIDNMLSGLGIEARFFDEPLKMLSGGYKLRVLLARTLFQNPSVLLLDEPTNHLDILSIRWLERFLKSTYRGLVIFISHDIGFINNLADYILDLDYGEIRQYKGPYAQFLAEKKLREEQIVIERKGIEAKISEMQKFIDRNKAKSAKAGQARSRMKMIDKMEIPDLKQTSRMAPGFRFAPARPSGKTVLKVEGLTKSYGDKTLFADFDLEIARGEKVAVMGINGIGKSTLIKLAGKVLTPDAGSLSPGHEVHAGYFSQDHHDMLKGRMSVFEWLRDSLSGVSDMQVRRVLGQALFTREETDKAITALSGGEAARLLLAKIMLESPNFMLLDEPTNHMDLESIEALSTACREYRGTILFVSHNRDFVDKVASRILYFAPNQEFIDFKGHFSEFSREYLDRD